MNKIDGRVQKTLNKIKKRNKLLSLLWLNQEEFFLNYKNLKKSLKLKFICLKCNNYFERSVWSHVSKKIYHCPYCKNNRLNFKLFLKQFLQKKLNKKFWLKINERWWNQNYKNTQTKIFLKCKKCKKEVTIDINNLLYQQAGCKFCAQKYRSIKNQTIIKESFLKKAKEIHGDKYDYSLITKEWWRENFKGSKRTTYVQIPLICKKHGIFNTTFSKHIHQGSGCPKCYASKGENKIMRFLEKNKINFKYQYKIQKFRFDFYLPQFKLFIEYDGKQHFEPIKHFGYKNYIKTMKNDINKFQFCKAYGFKLIHFDYKQYKKLEFFLKMTLKIFGMKFEDE